MKDDARLQQLELQLNVVIKNFEREMRARGFDPEQVDNVALPSSLATLFLEKQSLEDEIDKLKGEYNERSRTNN